MPLPSKMVPTDVQALQIHGVPKGSLGSHLGLCDIIHAGHCVLDGQHYEFLGDALSAVALIGPGEFDNSDFTFPIAYWDAKASGR